MRPSARPAAGPPEATSTAADGPSGGAPAPAGSGAQAYEHTINVDGPEAGAHLHVVRRELTAWLCGHPRVDDLCLVVSELLTNALVYGASSGGTVRVRVVRTADDGLTVDVTDSGQTGDAPCSGAGLGLGLRIVRTLARRCRTRTTPEGGRRMHVLLSPKPPEDQSPGT